MNKPVFYDPQRKRWKRLRRIFDVVALAGLLLGVLFVIGLARMKPLPELLLQSQKRNFRALQSEPVPVVKPGQKLTRSAHRRTSLKPSDVPLNSGEGLRAAYYVDWDAASYSSLKQHIKQIDLLFPEWLHVVTPDGSLMAYTPNDNRAYPVVDNAGVHSVDAEDKVAHVIASEGVDTEVFPLVNNYNPTTGLFMPGIGDFLNNPASRANFIHQVDTFLAANNRYRGLSIDFEEIPENAQPGYNAFVQELYQDFHPRHLRLYLKTPIGDMDYDLKHLADNSDGLLLMNYDQHMTSTESGPIAAQDWFVDNLTNALKVVPKEKIICDLGSYGYDWTVQLPAPAGPLKRGQKRPSAPPEKVLGVRYISTQNAWQAAFDSEANVALDPDSLNAHFALR